jgi:hypothetical protein
LQSSPCPEAVTTDTDGHSHCVPYVDGSRQQYFFQLQIYIPIEPGQDI